MLSLCYLRMELRGKQIFVMDPNKKLFYCRLFHLYFVETLYIKSSRTVLSVLT